jgi:isopentenyldiphosphate isomerase
LSEKLKIFNENRYAIGIADREEVHKIGHWHETFHCWYVEKKKGIDYIYFQKRCDEKKDFPNLYDITAAGHIMANESVTEGIREVKEELGMDVHREELTSLGIIEDSIVTDTIIDREFAHVFLYHYRDKKDFNIQKEEVSGIVKAELNHFVDLCSGEKDEILVEGFVLDKCDKRVSIKKSVRLEEFVPHQKLYLEKVLKLIKEKV